MLAAIEVLVLAPTVIKFVTLPLILISASNTVLSSYWLLVVFFL